MTHYYTEDEFEEKSSNQEYYLLKKIPHLEQIDSGSPWNFLYLFPSRYLQSMEVSSVLMNYIGREVERVREILSQIHSKKEKGMTRQIDKKKIKGEREKCRVDGIEEKRKKEHELETR